MITGTFTATDQGFSGEIRFFGKREQVLLRPVEPQENEKAPDFRIQPIDDDRIEFGAAWRRTSKGGRDYICLKLNPVVSAPVYLRLYETETAGVHELVVN